MQGRELRRKIEENGLIIIAGMITLLYWLFDFLIAGQVFTRTIIALFICIYGVFTQHLISSQRAAKKALQEAHRELEQRSLQIEAASRELEEINKKLKLAYAWMRDSRDDLRQHMYEEDIGFLTDKEVRSRASRCALWNIREYRTKPCWEAISWIFCMTVAGKISSGNCRRHGKG